MEDGGRGGKWADNHSENPKGVLFGREIGILLALVCFDIFRKRGLVLEGWARL